MHQRHHDGSLIKLSAIRTAFGHDTNQPFMLPELIVSRDTVRFHCLTAIESLVQD